jgi:hypothetical protein
VTWSSEDGGPRRQQLVAGGLRIAAGERLAVTTRIAPATTMLVADAAGERWYLLRHTAGDAAVAIVERIDPTSLDCLTSSGELPGGPVWPGGLAVLADGSVAVVFGNHAHRLDGSTLSVLATRTLARPRPYNSFVVLPDGHLVTKDFAGSRPGVPVPAAAREPCELVVLEPAGLEIVDRYVLAEPSIARLSADGDRVYVVGDTSLRRLEWNGTQLLEEQPVFRAPYRSIEGQTYGWDCVIAGGRAWFLDDGEGSDGFAGTLRGKGVSTAPLHLVRVDVETRAVAMVEVCGLPGGLVANPPVVDVGRGIAVAYDSGNGVLCGFDAATLALRWRRDQDHGSHLLLYEETGELVTGDHTDVVVLDVATGAELARADAGLGMQSVLFPAPGRGRDFYVCALTGVSRVEVVPA